MYLKRQLKEKLWLYYKILKEKSICACWMQAQWSVRLENLVCKKKRFGNVTVTRAIEKVWLSKAVTNMYEPDTVSC